MMRQYKSGSRWAFWRWTDVVLENELYLRRLHVVQIPRVGAIMLHWIYHPDNQRDLHDHPVTFFSIILRGSYGEQRFDGYHLRKWWNFVRATDAHRISDVYGPHGVLTLVFAGPKRRNWGFFTAKGWIPWQQYKDS